MAESKVVSIRIPQNLLDVIDRLATLGYPSRRLGGEPNRSQLILDFISSGIQNATADTVNNRLTVSSDAIETQLEALVDEKLAPIQEKLAALELALGDCCLRAENSELRQQSQHLPDLETMRDRYLSKLGKGKQAPEYKRSKATIDRFITEVQTLLSERLGLV